MSNAERRRSRFAGHAVPQGTLSRLTAIHLVPQGTLSSRGPSPPEDPLSPDGDSPCLAAQFTLSRLTAIHLVPQGTLSCEAIHLVNTSLYARRQHPSAFAHALLYLRPSLGSCCRRPRKAGAVPFRVTVITS